MNSQGKITAKTVAIGGVYLALSVVILFLSTFIPGIELTLLTLSSFIVAFFIVETSGTGGWVFYIATLFLTFLIVPNKAGVIPFTIFFGLYPILKYFVESFKKFPFAIELIMKLVLCNLCFGAGIVFFQKLFLDLIKLPDLALPILIIIAQVFFLVYDYLLTLAIGFYMKKRPKG